MLKIDIDTKRRLPLIELVARARRAHVTITALGEQTSPSGRGFHQWIVVAPPPRSCVEVVALQLLFGSDPLREAYCLNRARRIDRGDVKGLFARPDFWNVFYEAKRPH